MTNYLDKATEIIKKFEGLKLKAYKPIPSDPWTIGYGATGAGINSTTVWSLGQAEADLKRRIKEIAVYILDKVYQKLTDNQIAAIISLTYNIGITAFLNSTLLKKINAKDFKGAAKEFDRWVYGGKVKLAGLVKRRAEERKLFES